MQSVVAGLVLGGIGSEFYMGVFPQVINNTTIYTSWVFIATIVLFVLFSFRGSEYTTTFFYLIFYFGTIFTTLLRKENTIQIYDKYKLSNNTKNFRELFLPIISNIFSNWWDNEQGQDMETALQTSILSVSNEKWREFWSKISLNISNEKKDNIEKNMWVKFIENTIGLLKTKTEWEELWKKGHPNGKENNIETIKKTQEKAKNKFLTSLSFQQLNNFADNNIPTSHIINKSVQDNSYRKDFVNKLSKSLSAILIISSLFGAVFWIIRMGRYIEINPLQTGLTLLVFFMLIMFNVTELLGTYWSNSFLQKSGSIGNLIITSVLTGGMLSNGTFAGLGVSTAMILFGIIFQEKA